MNDMADTLNVHTFETTGGARIFQIPALAFPRLWGYVYLVLAEDDQGQSYRVLIDSGSGFGEANQHLESGLQAVSASLIYIGFGRPDAYFDHARHIDHFG
jgi:hypothetical protein